ncbi:FlgO family outer membrane protein [Desulfonatronospira sp.]|uniref:FlgO family outer membrane protein n=1 Tax=Desulfonatronospira sp. TaxID=1962951 RepID=UPI0025C6B961|nr:FlgO family outer membrane protein [Desulfonatronospira sp.]
MIGENHRAGYELQKMLVYTLPHEPTILLTTFVNLDNLGETSSLGRIVPQQIGTSLTRCGFEVVDVRLRTDSLLVREQQGEFALSRKIQDIARDNQANYVLAGTYSVLYNSILVNAKVLRSTDGLTVAATDYYLPYQAAALDPAGFSGEHAAGGKFTPNVHTGF